MKKILFVFILISIFSCRQEDSVFFSESLPSENSMINTLSTLRTLDQISDAAENAYQIFLGKAKGRGTCRISDIKPILLSEGRSESDSILYAVNYEDGGYAILTSAKSLYPLIAIIEDGEYNESSILENPGMSMFLLAAKDSIRDLINPWEELRQCKDTTIIYRYEYGPLVTVNWDQSGCEGYYCPNKICGCSNTALAQAMSYFCEPTSILLEFDEYQGTNLILDWDEIKLHNQSNVPNPFWCTNENDQPSCEASLEAHQALGKLCRQLGKHSNSNYSEKSTATPFRYTQSVAKYYLPDRTVSDIMSYNSPLWCPGGIMIMCGTSSTSNTAHAWIKDGHSWIVTRYEHYEKGPLDPGFILTHSSESEVHYSHINWGWNGSNNGYFADGFFNTANGNPFDSTTNTGNYNFDKDIKYFYIQ